MFPESGVNIVSVVLHSHLAGRRLSLKHIRQGKELPRIVEDNHFDFEYQQSHTLEKEVKVLPGDELVAECVYGTLDRTKPTLGGYAASQEMCLAFVVHYPRTPLAACYSMTPLKHLFKTLGVYSFKGVTMDHLEKLFLTTRTDAVTIPSTGQQQLPIYPATRPSEDIDEELIREAKSALRAVKDYTLEQDNENVFSRLIIEEPEEFRDPELRKYCLSVSREGRTLAEHMLALPWTEELLARAIEQNLYHGRHMTFCRKRDDKLALPADIQTFPNYTELPEVNETMCTEMAKLSNASGTSYLDIATFLTILAIKPRLIPKMRRTRYVALPVRAWHYVGLLVVSLACLTLGLVSRDKEGRAGSLAGPELKHQAPHEVDACPNLTPFTKMPSCSSFEQDQTRISMTTTRTSITPSHLTLSRSRSLDRISRTREDVERSDRRRGTSTENNPRRSLESRLRSESQDHLRLASDPSIRLSRSRNSRVQERRSIDSNRRREMNGRVDDSRDRERLTRSLERLASTDFRRERNDRSLRDADRRNRMQLTIRRDSRLEQNRRSLTGLEQRADDRVSRLDRRVDARTNERRDSIRSLKRFGDEMERRERNNRLNLARERRESRLDIRAPERVIRDSRDRSSERRMLVDSKRNSERRSTSVKSRNREEIKADRRLTEERANRFVEQRTDRRLMERRADRRLMERKIDRVVEQNVDRRLSEERADRRLIERRMDRQIMERRADRRLVDQRADRSIERKANQRLVEQRVDRRLMDQRADRSIERKANQRLMEQRTDRRLMDQRVDRSIERKANQRLVEQRTDRYLMDQRVDHRSMERKANQRLMEQRVDRRLMDQRADRSIERKANQRLVEQRVDRRLMDQRADRSIERKANQRLMEQRTDRRLMDQRADRRLMDQRVDRSMERNQQRKANQRIVEQRTDRRMMEQRADRRLMERRLAELRTDRRDLNSKRSTRQRVDGQRSTTPTLLPNDIRSNQKEQRDAERVRGVLIFSRDRSLNDIKRSRSVDREYVRSTDRDSRSRRQSNSRDLSEDSTFLRRHIRSSRLPIQERNSRIPVNTRSLAMRDKVLTHNNEYVPRMGVTEFLKQESHVSFDIIRQAFQLREAGTTIHSMVESHPRRNNNLLLPRLAFNHCFSIIFFGIAMYLTRNCILMYS
ncbi:MOXD1-like protein [Apis cerana cerana]|uniref:MOXD1-like protein n=1 Tax=Apis cerana cerana TaxID=94128 RepID=A0A2A3E7Q8_APICC|nr:MOXD1-like protein [Apis cerana cerana]